MNILLIDTTVRKKLYPITLTRAIADIRMGIFTVRERWQKLYEGAKIFIATDVYLQDLYPEVFANEYFVIDAAVIPDQYLLNEIESLKTDKAIHDNKGFVAGRTRVNNVQEVHKQVSELVCEKIIAPVLRLEFTASLFQLNSRLIEFDFKLHTRKRYSANTNDSVNLIKASGVFVEEGAEIDFSVINAKDGPVYIGRNTVIMENTSIRGPFVLCEGATLKMGTRVYGGTTIGPYGTAAGEIKNSVIMGYSNKGHHGYMGDSYVGEWCNWGAGTSNSNVKNTGGDVRLYDYDSGEPITVGKKCGVIMGDYTRTAINQSINTGTVVGICCNVFSAGLPPSFIPSFSWGVNGDCRYNLEKAFIDINNWKQMKNKSMTEMERQVLQHIFEQPIK